MKRTLVIPSLTAIAVGAALLALPLQSFAGATRLTSHSKKAACKTTKPKSHKPRAMTAGQNEVTFGIKGGNILPWTATIAGDGTVTTTGWEKAHNGKLADAANTLNGLFKLADAQGFFTMAGMTSCTGTNPDVATRFITLYSGSGSHEVDVHGTCVRGFNQLYATVQNEVDLQH